MPTSGAVRAGAKAEKKKKTTAGPNARRSHQNTVPLPDHGSDNPLLTRIKPVGAVTNAMDILQELSTSGRTLGATEIARALKMNRSTCFNILRTMASRDLVHFDDKTKTYGIGLGLVELARSALDPANELSSIRHLMDDVAGDFQVIVTVWRRSGRHRIVLMASAVSDAPVRLHMSLGQRLPLLSGSMGRILASYSGYSESETRAQLAQVRWAVPITVDRMMAESQKAKEQGWSIDEGEFLQGMTSIAVPLLDGRDRLRFVCCATMLRGHLEPADVTRLTQRLMAVGKAFREHPTRG